MRQGCSEWIAAEGFFDLSSAQRLRSFLQRHSKRKLPIYFQSSGGIMGQALAIELRVGSLFLAVPSVTFGRTSFSGQERIAVTAGLSNKGDEPVKDLPVILTIDGHEIQTERATNLRFFQVEVLLARVLRQRLNRFVRFGRRYAPCVVQRLVENCVEVRRHPIPRILAGNANHILTGRYDLTAWTNRSDTLSALSVVHHEPLEWETTLAGTCLVSPLRAYT
jgi:hypothetical protein